MRCAIGQEWDGKTCRGGAVLCTWTQAIESCENYRYSFAGYNDWQLPEIDELKSIVDRKSRSPKIDPGAFPNTPLSHFWSLTCEVVGTSRRYLKAHYINFDNGNVHDASTNSCAYVRLVRKEAITVLSGDLPRVGSIDKTVGASDASTLRELVKPNSDLDVAITASSEKFNIGMPATAAHGIIRAAIQLLKTHTTEFDSEIDEIRQVLANRKQSPLLEAEPNGGMLQLNETAALTSLSLVLASMSDMSVIPLVVLRKYLLPLDLMPSAVIESVNEKAFDLVGEPALEENGEQVTVFREVLARVLENWDTPST